MADSIEILSVPKKARSAIEGLVSPASKHDGIALYIEVGTQAFVLV